MPGLVPHPLFHRLHDRFRLRLTTVLWPRLELATPQEEGTRATLPATRENTEMRSPLPAGQETYEAHKRINEKFGE
jgi:hypothetical protein